MELSVEKDFEVIAQRLMCHIETETLREKVKYVVDQLNLTIRHQTQNLQHIITRPNVAFFREEIEFIFKKRLEMAEFINDSTVSEFLSLELFEWMGMENPDKFFEFVKDIYFSLNYIKRKNCDAGITHTDIQVLEWMGCEELGLGVGHDIDTSKIRRLRTDRAIYTQALGVNFTNDEQVKQWIGHHIYRTLINHFIAKYFTY